MAKKKGGGGGKSFVSLARYILCMTAIKQLSTIYSSMHEFTN